MSELAFTPEVPKNLLNGLLRCLFGSINPEADARHCCTQRTVKVCCPGVTLWTLWSVDVSLVSHHIDIWSKNHQREREARQLLLQVMPAITHDDVIEHNGKPCLEERSAKQTHILETQAKLLRLLSSRFAGLTDPRST